MENIYVKRYYKVYLIIAIIVNPENAISSYYCLVLFIYFVMEEGCACKHCRIGILKYSIKKKKKKLKSI